MAGSITFGSTPQYTPGQVASGNIPVNIGPAPAPYMQNMPSSTRDFQVTDPNAAQTAALIAQSNALLAQFKAQQSAIAPDLNLGSVYNQARGSAESAVNPYYTKQLQDFQAQQAAEKATQQQQTQTNIQNLQQQLQDTLQGNAITGARTTQDVATQEQQIAQKADRTQQDQGTQFDQARIAQAKQLASQGLTTSGLGQQQAFQSEAGRNLQETRQAQDVAQQNQAQELLKTRTFEDLARSGTLATQAETKGETQQNFDLNKYIQGQGFALNQQKDTLEQQRLSRVGQETQSQAKMLVNQFIQSIADPAQRQAAVQAYGGAF